MMESSKYKYDVALSFLAKDEPLASKLYNALKEKTEVFFYSERQKEIAGKDGEVTFNMVFGEESRVVIVLYREGWGSTSWTRIEETAIKNRAMNEGYEFVLFIPLDQPPTVPSYLPKTYIWYGIHKYGFETALSVVESKIQAEGGKIKIEGPEDIAKRIKEEEVFNQKRVAFLHSQEGVQLAISEVNILKELCKKKKELIEKDGTSIGFYEGDYNFSIMSYGFAIRFGWNSSYINSLEEAYLYLALQIPGRYQPPTIISEHEFNFDLLPTDQNIWVDTSNRSKYYTSEELVDFAFGLLFKHIEKETKEKRLGKYL